MFGSDFKMSAEASDAQTDEECEELVEDSFSFSADILEKSTRRKRSSGKPSPTPRSPYLSSLNVNPRRAAVAAWRLPRASLGDTRGEAAGESGSARLSSLSNGHDLSPTLRSVCDVTPELLKQTLGLRKHKPAASNGFTFSSGEHREKEDMYDEIIRLKKNLHLQKSDHQQLKAKLRRLEEDNAKREKQIEELLDPTKGSEYTRSLVDKKKEGSVVVNGLKQRILKLEQQFREKENALSKLQSELRTTNLEELKITVETYFEEIQRLRVLLEAAEKSSRAESKCSQRQQKALSTTVHRLSENLKQLQQENTTLREELNTDGPAGGSKGYREWSKQRLLRRLLAVEKRQEESRRTAHSAKSSVQLDQEVQTSPADIPGLTIATEAAVSVGTITEEEEEQEEVSRLRERLSQSEKEKEELQESLTRKDDEVSRLRTEREELEKETERWKKEQTDERDKERQQHEQELDKLSGRIEPAQAELSSLERAASVGRSDPDETEAGGGDEEDTGPEGGRDAKETRPEKRTLKVRERAANVIQTNWRRHRNKDIVMLQSALRGHLLRQARLADLLRDSQSQATVATNRRHASSSVGGEVDAVAMTMIQSAFRGHLAREGLLESSGYCVPSPVGNTLVQRGARPTHSRTGASSHHDDESKRGDEDGDDDDDDDEDLWPVPSIRSSRMTPTEQMAPRCTAAAGGASAVDSDDSDDIIVSPSRPLRGREVLIL